MKHVYENEPVLSTPSFLCKSNLIKFSSERPHFETEAKGNCQLGNGLLDLRILCQCNLKHCHLIIVISFIIEL